MTKFCRSLVLIKAIALRATANLGEYKFSSCLFKCRNEPLYPRAWADNPKITHPNVICDFSIICIHLWNEIHKRQHNSICKHLLSFYHRQGPIVDSMGEKRQDTCPWKICNRVRTFIIIVDLWVYLSGKGLPFQHHDSFMNFCDAFTNSMLALVSLY